MKFRRPKSQPRIPGHSRRPVGSAFEDRLEQAVQAEMRHFGVSRSFVIAVATADALGVELDVRHDYRRTMREKKAG